jgi:hypothetical protein
MEVMTTSGVRGRVVNSWPCPLCENRPAPPKPPAPECQSATALVGTQSARQARMLRDVNSAERRRWCPSPIRARPRVINSGREPREPFQRDRGVSAQYHMMLFNMPFIHDLKKKRRVPISGGSQRGLDEGGRPPRPAAGAWAARRRRPRFVYGPPSPLSPVPPPSMRFLNSTVASERRRVGQGALGTKPGPVGGLGHPWRHLPCGVRLTVRPSPGHNQLPAARWPRGLGPGAAAGCHPAPTGAAHGTPVRRCAPGGGS